MMTHEWSPLQRLMFLGAAANGKLVEDTATGNPLTFVTEKAKPLRSLLIPLLPRQSGTGDPSPSNIRPLLPWGEVGTWHGGKNLLNAIQSNAINYGNYNNYTLNDGEMIVDGGVLMGFKVRCKPLTTYTFSIKSTKNNYNLHLRVYAFENEPTTYDTSRGRLNEQNNLFGSFTTQATDNWLLVGVYVDSTFGATGLTISDFMLEVGDTATPYTPYSPITPFPVNLQANLLDDSKRYSNETTIYIGRETSAIQYTALEAGTYTISVDMDEPYGMYYREKDDATNRTIWQSGKNIKSATFTIESDGQYWFWLYRGASSGGVDPTKVHTIMLNTGETAEPYQPYLPPVYGCEIDLITGEVWGTWASYSAKWKDGVNTGTVGGTIERKYFPMPVTFVNATGTASAYCNVAKWKWHYEEASIHFYSHASTSYVFLPDDTDGETDIFIVGKLATPVLLATLTPQQINALVGTNTIWSDANGENTVVYLKKA